MSAENSERAIFDEWLAPDTPVERRLALVRSAHEGPLHRWSVSRRVNNARNDEPDMLRPLDDYSPAEARSEGSEDPRTNGSKGRSRQRRQATTR